MSGKHKPKYKRIAQLKTYADFQSYLSSLETTLPMDEHLITGDDSPFGEKYVLRSGKTIGNRFSILPMEGWDGTTDGMPSEHSRRRWYNFAISGAKLLWGCEAVAVRHEGRANPNQLLIHRDNADVYKGMFEQLYNDHRNKFGNADDLLVGFQLTHSGRFCKPNDKKRMEPQILYPHPVLNRKFGLSSDYPVMTDDYIDRLIEDFVKASKLVAAAGYHFVDIKHCHGYLGHEFLSATERPGKYGGSFENRTRFLREIVTGIRAEAPQLDVGVRLSAFDYVPFKPGEDQMGVPEQTGGSYGYAFGGDPSGTRIDYEEPFKFLQLLRFLDIELLCTTAGSPYYNPHIQRPALFPPSDGYQPPEDPLVGVARQLEATAVIKKAFPDLAVVGSAYSYLQEWLPNVAQNVLREKGADFIGLGRMVLSYPEMPDDILSHRSLKREKLCRTFSDCTTAPRNGMLSGCFPLDPYYKSMAEAQMLKALKAE
jgi:NADPH2 dehydrogenase